MTKTADLAQLNRVLQYIFSNEDAGWIRIVHCYTEEEKIPRNLREYAALLDVMYPDVRIDLVLVQYEFGPAVISYLSQRLGIPANCMFITCPGGNFKYRLETLGGVRVILNDDDVGAPGEEGEERGGRGGTIYRRLESQLLVEGEAG